MHPIVGMRKLKGGLIKTRFNMIPINKGKISNGVRLPNQFNKLAIGGSAHKKDYEHLEEMSEGGKVKRIRIQPLKFKY